jgi:hypothetical protein
MKSIDELAVKLKGNVMGTKNICLVSPESDIMSRVEIVESEFT